MREGEEALRKSEATARALINAPTDSVFLLDLQGVILDLNETAAARIGRRKDELIGVLGDTVLPETIVRARREMIFQVIKTRTAIRFEDERNGMWFDTVAYPVIDERGTVQKIAVIARDVTDRKRIEEALRVSEERFRIVTEFAPTGFALVDNEGKTEYLNPAFTGILGYLAGDIPDAASFTKKAFPDQEYRAQILELWEQEQKTTEQQGLRSIPVRIITVRCKDGTDKKIRFRRVVLQDRRVLVAIEDNPSDY
jgi:PAS domain S-box-containing protein